MDRTIDDQITRIVKKKKNVKTTEKKSKTIQKSRKQLRVKNFRYRKRSAKCVVCTRIIVRTVINNTQLNDVIGPQQLDTNDPIEVYEAR